MPTTSANFVTTHGFNVSRQGVQTGSPTLIKQPKDGWIKGTLHTVIEIDHEASADQLQATNSSDGVCVCAQPVSSSLESQDDITDPTILITFKAPPARTLAPPPRPREDFCMFTGEGVITRSPIGSAAGGYCPAHTQGTYRPQQPLNLRAAVSPSMVVTGAETCDMSNLKSDSGGAPRRKAADGRSRNGKWVTEYQASYCRDWSKL